MYEIKNFYENRNKNGFYYPKEYFELQFIFAKKWSEIEGINLFNSIKSKTSIPQKIFTNINDFNLFSQKEINDFQNIEKLSSNFYDFYIQEKKSKKNIQNNSYLNKKFGCFSFSFINNEKIHIHFLNETDNFISNLSNDRLNYRQICLLNMFDYIEENFPNTKKVAGESWLYSIKNYQETFPDEYIQTMKKVVPYKFTKKIPGTISSYNFFKYDSLWGQFIDRFGLIRKKIFDETIDKINYSNSTINLINAFPELPRRCISPIKIFYDWKSSFRNHL